MAAIGNSPTQQAFTPAIDYFSGNGSTTAFTLSRPVASVAQVQVTIDNVAQNPSSAYTVSANTITFTSAPLSGTNNIYVYYTSPITQVIAPGQGTVNTTALGNITNIASGNSSLTLQTGSGNTTAVTVDTSQNVGVGTSSPSFTAGSNGVMISGTKPALRLSSTTTGAGTWEIYADSAASGGLGFYERQNSSTAMYIDEGGNVGIGTASPSAKLHVSGGQSYVTGASSAGAYSRWYNNAQTTGDFQVGQGWLSASDNIGVLCNNANAAMILATNGTERMRISSGGYAGFNTSDYSTDNGNVGYIYAFSGGSNNVISTYTSSTVNRYAVFEYRRTGRSSARVAQISMGENSSSQGEVTCYSSTANSNVSGGVNLANGATSWSAVSDINKKDIIEPITNGLQKVSTLRAIIGKYKTDEEGTRRSFLIAQDVQAVLPEAVGQITDITDGSMALGLSYTDVIPLLVASIKELKAINDQQAETINALTARIEALENR